MGFSHLVFVPFLGRYQHKAKGTSSKKTLRDFQKLNPWELTGFPPKVTNTFKNSRKPPPTSEIFSIPCFFCFKIPPHFQALKRVDDWKPRTISYGRICWFPVIRIPRFAGESFEGQAVLVLGQGNAALETAQELQQYTSELHLLARGRPLPQGGTGVRLAYQTHYVT